MDKTTIGNSIYDFNFSLIKYRSRDAKSTVIPIKKGAIKYLEIEDNLTNFGYTGTLIFSNYAGILDHLGLGGGINDEVLLFDVNIKNLNFGSLNKDNVQDITIQTIFQLQENTDFNQDPVERNIAYNFDEYIIALLKQKRASPTSLQQGKVSDIIKNYIATNISDQIIDDTKFQENDISVDISGLAKDEYSIHDVILSLYKYLYYSNDRSPGIIQLKNYQNSKDKEYVTRKFTATPLFKFFSDFTKKLNENDSNLQEYVLEKFNIGGESSEPTYRDNLIDSYSLIRPDFDHLLSKRWVNYKVSLPSVGDITRNSNKVLFYKDLKEEFEKSALNGYKSNLPDRSDIKIADDEIVTRPFVNEGLAGLNIQSESSILEGGIKNLAYKSFVFDNTAITFRITGNPYRIPGMFIYINSEQGGDLQTSIQGYWFIVGVKHILENETYKNEIAAVKLFYQDNVPRTSSSQVPLTTPIPINPDNNSPTPVNVTESEPGEFQQGTVELPELPADTSNLPSDALFPSPGTPIYNPPPETAALP